MSCTRELFQRHHLRCTKQRMAIYEALRDSHSHPTAEALFNMVKPNTDRLSLATVYNTLDALCEAGLVRKLPTTNGCCRFDADTSHHLHVRCLESGEIMDVPEELGSQLVDRLPAEVLAQIEKAMNVKIDRVQVQIMARTDTTR